MTKSAVLWTFLLVLANCHGFTVSGQVYPGRTDLFELSVIHINDFHARFEQTSPKSGRCMEGEEAKCVGGIARIYTAVTKLKKERPNAIFLNAGDNYQGSLWYNVHRWNVTAVFMNKLPHDAMTLGNHEFDNNVAGIVPFLKNVKSPVVVANIDSSEEPTMQGLYKNSTIIERGGKKIGVIGALIASTTSLSQTGKLKFLDEVTTVNEEAKKLKAEDVDIIIVLSHCGLPIERIMAAKCPDIDLIVGGHSHSFLYSGKPPFIDVPEDTYPVVVNQADTNRTVLIVQAAAFSKYVGNLTVWFDSDDEVVDWEGNPILLDYKILEDKEIIAEMAPWKAVVDAKGKEVIGETRVFLDVECRTRECVMGNLVCDAMVDAWVDEAESDEDWTYAAIACHNSGGFRASIQANINITVSDLIAAQPFENTYDVVDVKGTDFLQVMEIGVARSYSPDEYIGKGNFVCSGIKITYNLTMEPFHRVAEFKVRCQSCPYPKYEDIEMDKWYRIVLPSYIVDGGDRIHIFSKNGKLLKKGPLDQDVLISYIKKMSPLTTGLDGHIKYVGKWSGSAPPI